MFKLASAAKKRLGGRVSDARSRLRFDPIDGAQNSGSNADDNKMADPSGISKISLNYEAVGNGHGPVIGGEMR